MTISAVSLSRLRGIDWDFAGTSSESPFSAIHWYPGRFVSQIPAALIGVLSRPGERVLDPFCGSGTTLVEAQRLGRSAIGVDIQPIACLVARAKTLQLSGRSIARIAQSLTLRAREALAGAPVLLAKLPPLPAGVQAEKWYTIDVAQALRILWSTIVPLKGAQRCLADLAFSATLLPVCRETRHWGYVCDNTAPSGTHGGDVATEFGRVLERIARAYTERDVEYAQVHRSRHRAPLVKVVRGDARQAVLGLKPNSVDLVVTSPPYFGVCDYAKAQRLSMEWFNHDIEAIRQAEIGARSKRHRNSAALEYASEVACVLRAVRGRLKPGGALCMVVGQSQRREHVLADLREAMSTAGFEIVLELSRRVSSQRRQTPSIRGEHLLVAT